MRSTHSSPTVWALRILALLGFSALALGAPCGVSQVELPGLSESATVATDRDGVWHIDAANDLDLALVQGYVHCRDRFFQMDDTRRQVDGTEAELLGPGRLAADIQARVIGLHRAAQRSLDAAPARFRALLEAYADGVNHCLATLPLPPEYAQLELTTARPWEAVDTLKIGKAIAASLSLDVDTDLTQELFAYVQAGATLGFDGQALFSQDVFRSAPIDPASTIPDATNTTPYAVDWRTNKAAHLAAAAKAASRVREKLAVHPLFALALDRRQSFVGSNEWGVNGAASANGRPIIANDPHLSLNVPSTFWEWHLTVRNDPEEGPMNVTGVGFPGTAGVILGQNENITWGATTNPMDVSDVFLDELHVLQPACFALVPPALACIRSAGVFHRVDVEFPTYRFNATGDGMQDNLVVASGLPLEATIIATVPFRSFGPVIDITNPGVFPGGGVTTALVLQYTGFHATQELATFSIWNRAANLADFQDGLQFFDVGSQNWAYADRDGNLAYFTSAEMPLRTDLEQGAVVGVPPFFVRDGTSGANNWIEDAAHSQGQTIPFAILPADEMPQTVNPENGFFVNANNDPAGTTLDNDPLNQVRVSSANAIYYLNPGYAEGLRAGRITRLIQNELSGGGTVSTQEMKDFQGNTQQLDAEILVPFLLEAFANAAAPGAPAELASLAGEARIAEAIGRLESWDFSGPTGIVEGWDAGDVNGNRLPLSGGTPDQDEIAASVASTIYNLWRGYAVRTIVDARLTSFGLSAGSTEALKALHHLLDSDPYTGIAAAGFDWIPQPAALSPEQRRDLALLRALRDGLDALASPTFAPAFGQSPDQNDYRWGKLHRIVFDHLFDPSLSIPPQAGFEHLSPQLRGISRDGGYEVVNASGFSARSIGLDSFMFGGGPVRRYVGRAEADAIIGVNSVPGGPSGDPGDPDYATQLAVWLTADYHNVSLSSSGPKELFHPPLVP